MQLQLRGLSARATSTRHLPAGLSSSAAAAAMPTAPPGTPGGASQPHTPANGPVTESATPTHRAPQGAPALPPSVSEQNHTLQEWRSHASLLSAALLSSSATASPRRLPREGPLDGAADDFSLLAVGQSPLTGSMRCSSMPQLQNRTSAISSMIHTPIDGVRNALGDLFGELAEPSSRRLSSIEVCVCCDAIGSARPLCSVPHAGFRHSLATPATRVCHSSSDFLHTTA